MLGVSTLGVGTVLRLEGDAAWPMVKCLRRATNEYLTTPSSPPQKKKVSDETKKSRTIGRQGKSRNRRRFGQNERGEIKVVLVDPRQSVDVIILTRSSIGIYWVVAQAHT